ncbi:MAG: hypothetical protein ACP5ER_01145, partial [Candidatus Bathyarchaeales archaeon]
MEAIIKRLKHDKYGVSNVIVVMLSLVLIVVIVANVVLWSYQMNQFDWERMQEKIEVVETKSGESSWFVAQTEYAIEIGKNVSGSYTDTHLAEDGVWETFQEELSPAPRRYRLFINGTFAINIESYPLNNIQTVEILLKYNASDTGEKWYLKAYNWSAQAYSDNGFNDTSGNQPSTPGAWIY